MIMSGSQWKDINSDNINVSQNAINKLKLPDMILKVENDYIFADSNRVIDLENDNLIIDYAYIYKLLISVSNETRIDPVDAEFSRSENNYKEYEIKSGSNGSVVDIDETIKNINSWIVSVLNDEGEIDEINVELMPTEPNIAEEDYEYLNKTIISSFSTKFNPGDKNRTQNLKVSTQAVNDYIIMPGEVFSLNSILGPRTYAKGYKDAGIFANGRKSVGIAGGICQTSSTIFNALLLADFDVVERHRHSLPVPYLERGRDAAISSRQDLKMKNTHNYPIRITTSIDTNNGELKVSVFGKESENIKIETVHTKENGRNIYKTFKIYLNQNQEEINRVLIVTDKI